MQSNKILEGFVDFLKSKISGKKLLILGFGKEGQSTFLFLREHFPEISIAIADANTSILDHPLLNDVDRKALYLGENYISCLKEFEFIFKSPGVNLKTIDTDTSKLTSQTDLFLRYFKKIIIGVTGTKGKSTTSSLIHHMLKYARKDTIILGNIGLSCFNEISKIKNDSIVVFELSAHQLQYVSDSPKIAVLLNVFPEHLDYFSDFESYSEAKQNIFKFQSERDTLIIPSSLNSLIYGQQPIIKYFNDNKPEMQANWVEIIEKAAPSLSGKHNLLNVKAAILAAEAAGLSFDVAIQSISSFKPLPHRLEFAGRFNDIYFYNDSISTVPESTIAAIETLKYVDTVILGGFDRGLDYSKLVNYLSKSGITNYLFLGKAGKTMKVLFDQLDLVNIRLIEPESLEEAFKIIPKITTKGKICLLSPAAASYDQFDNFEHRGDAFKLLASKL